MGKSKVSKNSRTSRNNTTNYNAKEKKIKETILVELTKEVRAELTQDSNTYRGKEILENNVRKFGKNYMLVKNI